MHLSPLCQLIINFVQMCMNKAQTGAGGRWQFLKCSEILRLLQLLYFKNIIHC
jgi:hypothetical protein